MPRRARPTIHHRFAAYRAARAACAAVGRWLLGAALPAPHRDHVQRLAAEMCCELALGYAAPPASVQRASCHHRAWTCVRRLDAILDRLARRERDRDDLGPVRRAIDRADVLIGALPHVTVA